MQGRIAELAGRVLAGEALERAAAEELAAVQTDSLPDLFYWANRIRLKFIGPKVRLCAIVAGKAGGCSEDCRFCAQSRMARSCVGSGAQTSDEQILSAARRAAESGADSFGIVNSGRGPSRRELEQWLGPLMKQIAAGEPIRLCASLGTLTPPAVAFLRDCGVRRIHHNLETSERFFPQICTTHSYDERLRTLRAIKDAGLSICSGGIFGMGETWADRLDMAFALREIGPDVTPINFLNPIAGTPLEGREKLPAMECLKIIAVYRFLLPKVDLKVAGGREACLRDLQSWIFHAGASSLMIGNYLMTCGRDVEADHRMLRDLGIEAQTYAEA